MWTLKCDTSKYIYKTKRLTDIENKLMVINVTMEDKKNAGVAMLTSLK